MARGCSCAWFVERHKSGLNFALLVLAYVLYLVVGAAIFSTIELPYELELRKELKVAREGFLNEHTCVSEERLEELLARALAANNHGVSVSKNNIRDNWDFVSSLFFTSTVLTTTGYGHTVPLSDEGKAFCIFYTLLGLPATLFVLSVIVQRLLVVVSRRPVSYFHRRWAMPKANLAAVHAVCLALVMVLVFIIIPAWIFVTLESDWNFLEAVYFCFISLTTIGLGDYVPGETHSTKNNPHPQLYRLAITIYLLAGLVAILVVLETCYELPHMRRLRQRFYKEKVRDLDSETTNIIDQDHISDEPAARETPQPPVISSVLDQAASMRQDGVSAPYTRASGSTVNQKVQ